MMATQNCQTTLSATLYDIAVPKGTFAWGVSYFSKGLIFPFCLWGSETVPTSNYGKPLYKLSTYVKLT